MIVDPGPSDLGCITRTKRLGHALQGHGHLEDPAFQVAMLSKAVCDQPRRMGSCPPLHTHTSPLTKVQGPCCEVGLVALWNQKRALPLFSTNLSLMGGVYLASFSSVSRERKRAAEL